MPNDDFATNVQDLVGGGSVTIAQAIAGQTYHQSMPMVHAADTHKMVEHVALLELFPDASKPGVAVALNGGSWFDPSTWSTGKVPADGQDVYIPHGVSVVYDGVSDARLDRVAVDGGLHFAVNTDTRIVLDTLMTNSTSVLTIGTDANPVKAGVSAEIIIHRDNGAINHSEDPLELSKGIVSHGTVRIVGQDKTDHLKTSVDPQAGDDFLIFEGGVTGWLPGDKLVVAGTRLLGENMFEDEVVTIKAIRSNGDGTVEVFLDQVLQHDHIPPENSAGVDFRVPVANFTRNVFIGTETDGDQYLGDGKTVPVNERGHVMFMHNDDVSVQNAEFFELGRTDKSELLDADTNVAGRYALHFHRTGVSDLDNPALAEGNAVWGSPGWGIVHHDSNLDVISNAVFGVNGGAIIAEAGNETGIWADNITIQTTGEYSTLNSEHSGNKTHPAGRAQLENDIFTQGVGYGFKSRMIETTENIAVSSNAAGYSFWPMGTDGPSHINPLVENFASIYGYDPLFGQDDVLPSQIPNRAFSGNETIVAHVGFNTSADKRPSPTDVPTVIEDFTAWEVAQGFIGFYQNDYLVKDSVFVGMEGGLTSQHQNSAAGSDTTGIMSREFHELKLVNNHFENFDIGIWENNHDITADNIHVILGNTFVNVDQSQILDIDSSSNPDQYLINDNGVNWQNKVDLGRLEASVDTAKSDLTLTEWYDHFTVVVDKVDALGAQELSFGSINGRYGGASQKTWWSENASNKGYHVEAGKYYVIVEIAIGDRITGTVGVMPVAIELAFVKSATDLPADAVDLGGLPQGLGAFEIMDLRTIGTSGNQLNGPDPVIVVPDPVDPDPVDTAPDPVDTAPDPVDPDPVDGEAVAREILSVTGATELNGGRSAVLVYEHNAAFEVSAADISLTFNADTVDGIRGLISKDARDFQGGGNHLSAYLKFGVLQVHFEDESEELMFEFIGIKASQDYNLDISFGEDGVSVSLDGVVVGQDADFVMSWEDNSEYLQIGAVGRWHDTGTDGFKAYFDGTISDVSITTGDEFI